MLRFSILPALMLGGALAVSSNAAFAADAAAGKTLFRQQCTLCHTAEPNDGGGAQGPSLQGVFGRRAGSAPDFSYTAALRSSNLTWDAATLDRFLEAPTRVVPGSAMVTPVPRPEDRQNLIAYFQQVASLKPGAETAVAAGPQADDWKKDAPGRKHHVKASDLPAPFATPAVRNNVKTVSQPAEAKLAVPPGFKVDVFARDLSGPRVMRVAPNGDIFLAETSAGRIKVLRPSADGAKVQAVETFASDVDRPFGLAFYPSAKPEWLYVGEQNRVVRYAYKPGDTKAQGKPEVVVARLAPTTGGHTTRDLAFSRDSKSLFVSIGSQSNYAQDMPKKSPAEIKAWEATHGVGSSWGDEENRATVYEYDMAARTMKVFATGIRNCVGLAIQPVTDDVWCATNERDGLGDNLVPDYATRVKRGGYYGWPWYYLGANEEPRLKGDRPDLRGKAIVPDVLFTAHSAALSVTFYTATSGASEFPAEYRGDAFVALHGSWNRGERTGHKLVRVRIKDGVPTGEYEDFLTGFILSDNSAWGRPVSSTVAADGSLLLSDDGGNVIYRISYQATPATASVRENLQ